MGEWNVRIFEGICARAESHAFTIMLEGDQQRLIKSANFFTNIVAQTDKHVTGVMTDETRETKTNLTATISKPTGIANTARNASIDTEVKLRGTKTNVTANVLATMGIADTARGADTTIMEELQGTKTILCARFSETEDIVDSARSASIDTVRGEAPRDEDKLDCKFFRDRGYGRFEAATATPRISPRPSPVTQRKNHDVCLCLLESVSQP